MRYDAPDGGCRAQDPVGQTNATTTQSLEAARRPSSALANTWVSANRETCRRGPNPLWAAGVMQPTVAPGAGQWVGAY